MTRAARFAGCGLMLAAVALAGCKKEGDANASDIGAVNVDTANNQSLDGVSDTQLKAQAQALTPEQAAAAGVAVDTTIHMENMSSADSTPGGAANNDTAGTPPPPAAAPAAAPAPTAPPTRP
ncbi:MAG TPA: hypothetical protein VEX86_08380 [Longimicrobium sp.]|nr:hypothetical protein [Longimicrobium sp.]